MKWTREQQLENESELIFRSQLPKEWIVRRKNPDCGIDLELEIVEGEEVTNKVIWVQLKATDKDSSGNSLHYPIKTKHLKYYENCQLPVIIVLWNKFQNVFYCLFAQKLILEELNLKEPNWREKRTKTIVFPSESRLNDSHKLKSIATDGYLYIINRRYGLLSPSKTAIYWLDGIPKSDDQEIKEGTLKALFAIMKEKYDDSIAIFEVLLKACTVSPTERMSILLNLGNAYMILNRNLEAITNYNAVIALSGKVNDESAKEGKSFAIGNTGLVYLNLGELDKALSQFKKSLTILKTIGHKSGEATALGNIGVVYSTKGDFDKALRYHQEALKLHKEIGNKQAEADQIGNIGLIYSEKGDLESALMYQMEALRIDREIGYKQGEAADLGNIGVILCTPIFHT